MFTLMRNFYRYMKKKQDKSLTIVIIGCDNAGKTTLLSAIQGEVDAYVTPTWGFDSQTVQEGPYKVTFYDLGGGARIRGIWPRYFPDVHGAIFVVDSADEVRLEEVRETLVQSFQDDKLVGKPIVVFANKQDLKAALAADIISMKLGLHTIPNATFNIFPSIALTPSGQQTDPNIKKGLKWLTSYIESNFKHLSKRVEKESAEQRAQEKAELEERKKRVAKMKEERLKQEEEEERQRQLAEKEQQESANHEAISPVEGGAQQSQEDNSSITKAPSISIPIADDQNNHLNGAITPSSIHAIPAITPAASQPAFVMESGSSSARSGSFSARRPANLEYMSLSIPSSSEDSPSSGSSADSVPSISVSQQQQDSARDILRDSLTPLASSAASISSSSPSSPSSASGSGSYASISGGNSSSRNVQSNSWVDLPNAIPSPSKHGPDAV